MSEFSLEDYHEPVFEAGVIALDNLERAVKNPELLLADSVTGVSKIIDREDGALITSILIEYRSTVTDEIDAALVQYGELPAEYISGMFVSLSQSLVAHVNKTQDPFGHSPSFPPDAQSLKSHLNGIWMTLPIIDADSKYEIPLFNVGHKKDISLALVKNAEQKTWNVDYIYRCGVILMRNVFDNFKGEVTIVES